MRTTTSEFFRSLLADCPCGTVPDFPYGRCRKCRARAQWNRRHGGNSQTGRPRQSKYIYEIATTHERDGAWAIVTSDVITSARNPEAVARSVVERWVLDQGRGLIGGGQIYVYGSRIPDNRRLTFDATVRVQIYRADSAPSESRASATAYVGIPRRHTKLSTRRGPLRKSRGARLGAERNEMTEGIAS